jgi:hypothetical protein
VATIATIRTGHDARRALTLPLSLEPAAIIGLIAFPPLKPERVFVK